jgi:hypothetical protein
VRRPLKVLAGSLIFAFFVVSAGRAIDFELARAQVPPPVTLEQPGYRWQGRTAHWWAKRAVQARKDANARKQTILRLRRAQAKDAAHFFSWLRGAECIHSKERGADGWRTMTGNGYYGGMQADLSFQRAYGRPYLKWGTADNWPMWAQLHMAYNGWLVRSWEPWPNTARECGLL